MNYCVCSGKESNVCTIWSWMGGNKWHIQYHMGDILVLRFVDDLPEFAGIKDIVFDDDKVSAFWSRFMKQSA
jgi:hypothetical protein